MRWPRSVVGYEDETSGLAGTTAAVLVTWGNPWHSFSRVYAAFAELYPEGT